MKNFNFKDLQYAVGKYFSDNKNYVVELTCDEGNEIFGQPFNLIAFDDHAKAHGVLIMYYEDQLSELQEQGTPLCASLAIQNTWVCLTAEMYDQCKSQIDEYTGVLIYSRASNNKYKFVIHKNADTQHEYFFTQDMLLSLLKIQSHNFIQEKTLQLEIKRLRRTGFNI
jgi:hypothetical protein